MRSSALSHKVVLLGLSLILTLIILPVIDVGGKEFRFTWSQDLGGLCDIYEERQGGEDGNGLLVESGCSWRKLNVQRVLDESTKKHVKKRSEEYEQKLKSRKAIVLDQCNPSMKSQMQALAAAEAGPWKFKQKNKKFFEPSQVGSHPKPVKSSTVSSSTANAKGRHSTSPLPSPQTQSISLASAFVRGNATESQTVAENPTIQTRAKDNAVNFENEIPAQVSGRMTEALHGDNQGVGTSDLWNLLVTLLKDNPKGLSIKALEKAVGDMKSNSARKIEPILKKIATHEPSGRYILKSGMELESLKKSYSDSGSSPEDNNRKQFVPESRGEMPAPLSGSARKSPAEDVEEQVQKFDEESNMAEKFDASQHFSDLFGDDEPPERSERQTAKTNGSESDSDSNSDSGSSDSASRSRSRSPAGSGSASSSDSEGDASSSHSKESSDVDIDIMSDDDKETKKLQGTEHGLSKAPVPWSMPEAVPLQDGRSGDQDGYASEDVDIENDFLDDNESQLATAPLHLGIATEKLRTVSPDHDQNEPCNNRTDVSEREGFEDEVQREHHSFVKSGGKSKRGSDLIQFEHDADHVKKFKANTSQSISRPIVSRTFGSPPKHFVDIINEDNYENRNLHVSNQFNRDDSANTHLGVQRGYNNVVSGKSAVELIHSGRRPTAIAYNVEATDKAAKKLPNSGVDLKFQDTNAYGQEGSLKHADKGYRETQDEEESPNEKANGKFKESPLGQKNSIRPEPRHRKHSVRYKNSHTLGTSSRLHMGSSLKDSGKADFDRSSADRRRLQRELSDLEQGELRDPSPEEPEGTKRQFERAGSFKQSQAKLGTSGSRNAELKGIPVSKPFLDSGKTSSPNAKGAPNNTNNSSRKRSLEPYAEDSSRPHGTLPSQLQQSRNSSAEVGPLSNNAMDRSRLGHNEAVANQGTDVEGYGETQKKTQIIAQREDSRQEIGSHKGKGNKSRKSNISKDASGKKRQVSYTQDLNGKRTRRDSSSDEDTPYTKYEKEEPELKGPIKIFSQFKDYVQEYCEKYESYLSLFKILVRYKDEFQKLGMDLASAKGRDMERYYDTIGQLKESYSRCAMFVYKLVQRHKRLKKIFLVLHEELKHLKQMIHEADVDRLRE
ncbi:uncharacterized protein LOC104903669 isoform X4 [Beta vulgaris subsp. vulgaris]|uniref:uncharacterized protein LOC104903669 isoform X4 n=1 Tax=Beta vulgaris subsp. vulgaris TaxID=3555 RepID=UPI0020371699|nr:uncharacterized protein LOC104903669 isoform X4 [Beta vulgaris subsp. vulgaris]